jgi:hypothetical protein
VLDPVDLRGREHREPANEQRWPMCRLLAVVIVVG